MFGSSKIEGGGGGLRVGEGLEKGVCMALHDNKHLFKKTFVSA